MEYFKILLIIIIILTLLEIIPYFLTILFPDLCYGCTYIGKTQQYLNKEIKLGYISWFAYIILFIYFIYLATLLKNKILKYGLIIFFLLMIYLPTFPLLNIITIFLHFFYKNPPFITNYNNIFPSSVKIEKNSQIIINEYKTYIKNYKPECIRKNNPGFIIEINSIKNNCWRVIYLKRIGKIEETMIQYFPNTIELLKDKGVTIVSTMHDITLGAMYAERIIVMQNGKVLLDGSAAEVIHSNELKSAFDHGISVHTLKDGHTVITANKIRNEVI
jgi:hypothetical protein